MKCRTQPLPIIDHQEIKQLSLARIAVRLSCDTVSKARHLFLTLYGMTEVIP